MAIQGGLDTLQLGNLFKCQEGFEIVTVLDFDTRATSEWWSTNVVELNFNNKMIIRSDKYQH